AAGEFVLAPERGGERFEALRHITAEQPGQFVGGKGDHRIEAVALERCGKPSAEEAIDARPAERPDLIAHRLAPPGRADEIALRNVVVALKMEEQLVGEAERQPGASGEL